MKGIVKNVQGLNSYYRVRSASQSQDEFDDDEPIYRPGPFIREEPAHSSAEDESSARSRAEAQTRRGVKVTPQICCGIGGTSGTIIELPDLYSSEAYDLSALQRFSQCCNPNHDSTGSPKETSIAIIGLNWPNIPDLDAFAKQYGLLYNFTEKGDTSSTGGNLEMTLDVEAATAMANNFSGAVDTAHVYAYGFGGTTVDKLLDSWALAQSDDKARVASSSFGNVESAYQNPVNVSDFEGIILPMAAGGWTISAASGDHGATADCSILSVDYPASSPNVVAVGGTTLTLTNNNGKPKFGSEIAWGGPGCNGQPSSSPKSNNGGAGGGCSNVWPAPPYQSLAPGASSCGLRALPDVALNSGTGEGFYYNGGWIAPRGTSIASPAFAGFMSQVNSYLLSLGNICGDNPHNQPCTPFGNPDTKIWTMGALGTAATGRTPFYDINDESCNGDLVTGYCTGPGYDLATGWGSFNMLQLAWAFIDDVTFGTAPQVAFTGPMINTWSNTDHVDFTVSSPPPFGSNASVGIAGYTAQWDAVVVDALSHPTPASGDSFYDGPQTTGGSGSLSLAVAGLGCHTAHVRGWDNAGQTSGDQPYGPVCFDNQPPFDKCGKPDGLWHASDVSVNCLGFDQPNGSGLANPADAVFSLSTSVPAGAETASAFTNSHQFCDVAGNCATAGPIGPNMIDKKPPYDKCARPDGLWHASDVRINCVGFDDGSGLANPADAFFSLSTSVPAGAETASAFTNSHQFCDVVGNCATAGPIGPNMIDKKPPTIMISSPTSTQYTHSSTLTLSYTVTDGGSGVGTVTSTMNGSTTAGGSVISSGLVINLLTALPTGQNTFAISAADQVANKVSASVIFTIIVTPQSIIGDVNQFFASGAISSSSVESGLLQKLNDALTARNAGQCGQAGNVYSAFINQVMGQSGKGITAAAAAILIADAQYLIAHCP
jgi:hypothetical protein